MRLVILVFAAFVSGGTIAHGESLTVSPAAVPLGGKIGQSTTQRLTIFNGTSIPLAFDVVAQDVVVRGGERAFVEAGELPGSIAITATFSERFVRLAPGHQRSIDVTLTLPPKMSNRAVVILFRGTTKIGGRTSVSIGSLLTFELAGKTSAHLGEFRVQPPSASANAAFALAVDNDGTEPIVLRGVIAIIGADGRLASKLALEPKRLLPSERTMLRGDLYGALPSGRYRAIATLATGKTSWNRITEVVVP
jgi:hypothetical protein